MNRKVTNAIRFFMDECLPPVVRDSKWFMYPFFYLAYRGKDIDRVMEFKSLVYDMSDEEYNEFYRGLNSISRNRETDLSEECVEKILQAIPGEASTLLDVGCGHGYLLKRVKQFRGDMALSGCDVKTPPPHPAFDFREGQLTGLGLEQFDVVTCCHTLEHILKLQDFVAELVRLARKRLIVVVPRQRYFYYTLDEHVQFFHFERQLSSIFPIANYRCQEVAGDWVYVGMLDQN